MKRESHPSGGCFSEKDDKPAIQPGKEFCILNIFTNTTSTPALEKLNRLFGDDCIFVDEPGKADGLLLIREPGHSPLDFYNGRPAVFLAGAQDARGKMMVKAAAAKGIPGEMIVSCAPGGTLYLEEAVNLLKRAVAGSKDAPRHAGSVDAGAIRLESSAADDEPAPEIESATDEKGHSPSEAGEPQCPADNAERLPAINICLVSFKGGVGRTLLSACLAANFTSRGYRVALVDQGRLHYTPYHMGLPSRVDTFDGGYARTKWGDLFIQRPSQSFSEIAKKLHGYGVAIYDFPLGIPPGWERLLAVSIKVLVVDHDLRTLAVTREQLDSAGMDEYIVVANNIPPVSLGSYGKVVSDTLGLMPIEIPRESSIGAFVLNYSPASTHSLVLDKAVSALIEEITAKGVRKCV
jgi:hypothetical protein